MHCTKGWPALLMTAETSVSADRASAAELVLIAMSSATAALSWVAMVTVTSVFLIALARAQLLISRRSASANRLPEPIGDVPNAWGGSMLLRLLYVELGVVGGAAGGVGEDGGADGGSGTIGGEGSKGGR